MSEQQKPDVRIALAGNPNAGKTSLFNALTGAHQKVGNYPGVTVEKKQGRYRYQDQQYEIHDLPGTYSLTHYSPEERIARREILSGRYDVIVVVVDSTSLKRHLYLLTQVMLAESNIILALNMSDEAHAAGQQLDLEQMQNLLGFPVVETVGHKPAGIDRLKDLIEQVGRNPKPKPRLVVGDRLDGALCQLAPLLHDDRPDARPPRWLAMKLIEDDPTTEQWVRKRMPERFDRILQKAQSLREELEYETELDIATYLADQLYGFVFGLLKEVTLSEARENARQLSDKIDAILCSRRLGLVTFLAAMYLLFYLTFTLGDYPMGWIEAGFSWLGDTISGFWPEGSASPLRSLLVDGIIAGVGGVIVFLPNILLLFLGLAFLEDTGYLSRAAFLVDRVMHKFGLHGKSFIPMISGFGCTIPGILATRTLENERDRLTTMLVLPLMSCGARLPIWMLLIPAFFPEQWRAPMLWLIYMIGILLAVVLARLLRSTLLKGEETPFVMELPPYRMPTLKALIGKMFERGWLYMRKAGTIILGISIVMWLFSTYPQPESYQIDRDIERGKTRVLQPVVPENMPEEQHDKVIESQLYAARALAPDGVEILLPEQVERVKQMENLEYSAAGRIGKIMEWVTKPMGFDWRISTALIGAFAAKEVFVAQMGIVFALGDDESSTDSLRDRLAEAYTPLIAFSLMLFLLIATPCMATLAATRKESGSWKWAFLQFGGLTALAWVLSTLVYQIGRLLL